MNQGHRSIEGGRPGSNFGGVSREDFLDRVRASLRTPTRGVVNKTDAFAVPPAPEDLSVVRLADRSVDRVGILAERATKSGMAVHRCEADGVPEAVVGILRSVEARSAWFSLPAAECRTIRGECDRHGIRTLDDRSFQSGDERFEVDAGITDCEAGLAETGTLVLCSGPDRGRGVMIIPPVHIAILRERQILPDMLDVWERFPTDPEPGMADARRRIMPTSLVMVSGPSKTADIEGILITGVHGPKAVHVVLVSGPG